MRLLAEALFLSSLCLGLVTGGGLEGDSLPPTSQAESEPYRRLHPAYHIAAARGWINDPTGLFFFNGFYHVFYQANPSGAAIWGNISWAHVASADLAHWTRLPLALLPGPPGSPDEGGVFSGSVTVVDGLPRLLYTCASQRSRAFPGSYYQQQCAARPENASDPLLARWRKTGPLPRFDPPPGGSRYQFRDPGPGWRIPPSAPYRLLVGAQVGCRGAAALYRSPDFHNFTFEGLLAAQNASASLAAPFCKQYGDAAGGGADWETPALAPLQTLSSGGGGQSTLSALLYGDQISGRTPFGQSMVVLGVLSSNDTAAAFRPLAPARPIDGGDAYAAQTFAAADGARQLMLAWVAEGGGAAEALARGWAGVLTLPRVLRAAPRRGGAAPWLHQQPVEELRALRSPAAPTLDAPRILLYAGAPQLQLPLPPSPSAGRQREYEIGIDAAACAPLRLKASLLLTSTARGAAGPRTNVSLALDGAAGWGTLTVDRWRSGGPGDARPQASPFPLDALEEGPLRLRVFVDHSILEAFAGGLAAVASRVYPDEDADGGEWEAALEAEAACGAVGVAVRVWELASAFVDQAGSGS